MVHWENPVDFYGLKGSPMLFECNTLYFKYLEESFTQRTAIVRKKEARKQHEKCIVIAIINLKILWNQLIQGFSDLEKTNSFFSWSEKNPSFSKLFKLFKALRAVNIYAETPGNNSCTEIRKLL